MKEKSIQQHNIGLIKTAAAFHGYAYMEPWLNLKWADWVNDNVNVFTCPLHFHYKIWIDFTPASLPTDQLSHVIQLCNKWALWIPYESSPSVFPHYSGSDQCNHSLHKGRSSFLDDLVMKMKPHIFHWFISSWMKHAAHLFRIEFKNFSKILKFLREENFMFCDIVFLGWFCPCWSSHFRTLHFSLVFITLQILSGEKSGTMVMKGSLCGRTNWNWERLGTAPRIRDQLLYLFKKGAHFQSVFETERIDWIGQVTRPIIQAWRLSVVAYYSAVLFLLKWRLGGGIKALRKLVGVDYHHPFVFLRNITLLNESVSLWLGGRRTTPKSPPTNNHHVPICSYLY